MSAIRAPARNATRDAVTGRHRGVRRLLEDLSCSTGGEQRRLAKRPTGLAPFVDEPNAETASVLDDGADGERVLQHADTRARRGAFPQHAADLAPGRIGRMQNAAHAVRPLGCERRVARAGPGRTLHPTRSARACNVAPRRTARRPRAHRTGRHRRPSCLCACSSGESSGPIAAAMPPCAYSVLLSVGYGFRDDDDVARTRQLNRRAEAGDAAADDYEVAAYIHRCYPTSHLGE